MRQTLTLVKPLEIEMQCAGCLTDFDISTAL